MHPHVPLDGEQNAVVARLRGSGVLSRAQNLRTWRRKTRTPRAFVVKLGARCGYEACMDQGEQANVQDEKASCS